ncbi:phage head-tail joining protein [Salinarimonas chemoclinalis]|uniref:phage head-tail joining protein n=1 Tax=Salinarimonas chemoclinalis TaxID=3241599 RepID=UPI003558D6F5
MSDAAAIAARLETLRAARASAEKRVRFSDEEVEYRSDSEMAAAISDLERQLANATGRRVRAVRFSYSKGL